MTTTTSLNQILRSKKGQALVELTLIFPFMLALVYGVVEIGSVISTYLTLTHTTREGANLASRGTDPNTAVNAVITGAAPTIRGNNLTQWRVIYSRIVQKPGIPCPPKPCTYIVDTAPNGRIIQGNFNQSSKLGAVGATVTIPGINNVAAAQIFHAVEVYYDYGPNVMTYIGKNLINDTFYERSMFTDTKG